MQFAAWKGLDAGTLAPWAPVRVAVTLIGWQFVGLNSNPGRLIVTLTVRISEGIPDCRPSTLLTINGSGSERTVTWLSRG